MEKPRYDILDGLRGVAALMVLLYHVFNDAKSFFVWPTPVNEFYHSFLGVDFFFILSGFVMGYAYDERWKASTQPSQRETLTFWGFIKRRLIRLHPMVVMGVLAAAVVALDYIVPAWGTKKFGGTKRGTWGATIGVFVGMFFGPVGIFLCPLLGAFIGEYTGDSDSGRSLRAALGSFIGIMTGLVIKLIVSGAMVYYFAKELICGINTVGF